MAGGFHDDAVFPDRLKMGMDGGPTYRTTVQTSAGGGEQRFPEWDAPLYEWTIGLEFWDDARRDELLAFFHARQGQGYGFRFRDRLDHAAGLARNEDGAYVPSGDAVTLGTGDGSRTVFPLVKRYGPTTRRITRPVVGTVAVTVNGASASPSVDHTTGLVTFSSAPASGAVIASRFLFDVPCRFGQDDFKAHWDIRHVGSFEGIRIVSIRE